MFENDLKIGNHPAIFRQLEIEYDDRFDYLARDSEDVK